MWFISLSLFFVGTGLDVTIQSSLFTVVRNVEMQSDREQVI